MRFHIDGSYIGKLSEDGASITGAWTQRGEPHPLTLARVEGDAEWEIPKGEVKMAKDADPDWDVSTVKPTDPNVNNANMQMEGKAICDVGCRWRRCCRCHMACRRARWRMRRSGCDGAVGHIRGAGCAGEAERATDAGLARKLLTERFGLETHTEKREMEVYAMTVAKGGEKMTPAPAIRMGC